MQSRVNGLHHQGANRFQIGVDPRRHPQSNARESRRQISTPMVKGLPPHGIRNVPNACQVFLGTGPTKAHHGVIDEGNLNGRQYPIALLQRCRANFRGR